MERDRQRLNFFLLAPFEFKPACLSALPELFPDREGYKLQKIEEIGFGPAYLVHGKKKIYGLYRNKVHPEQIFAMSLNGSTHAISGVQWFIEKDGALRPAC